MYGLIENKLQLTEAEKRIKQPKYFHTEENVVVKDWYKAAYPTDTWGAEQIPSSLRFYQLAAGYIREGEEVVDTCIRRVIDGTSGSIIRFSDSVVESRIYEELCVNDGFSFGYIMEA